MNQQPTAHPDYESLKSVWNSIAQWVMNYRYARGIYNDLANCGPDEMERIARDLRIHRSELVTMAKKGPHAADLVKKLLGALGIDADKLEHEDPLTMRDLQRLCTTCTEKNNASLTLPTALLAIIFVTIARMPLHLMHC